MELEKLRKGQELLDKKSSIDKVIKIVKESGVGVAATDNVDNKEIDASNLLILMKPIFPDLLVKFNELSADYQREFFEL